MKNYFPEISDQTGETDMLAAYRSLGMMVYLDLDYWKGRSEARIGEYYEDLVGHMTTRTAYVVIGDENKPIGYVTWNFDEDDKGKIEITRQAAPFGDRLILQRALRAHLPNIARADSVHTRSARRSQSAW